ncbi:MAG: hypothetical protein J6S76_07655 [Clostridia bacterium]|nr:hypothetical protein [Clostridia bacterium]
MTDIYEYILYFSFFGLPIAALIWFFVSTYRFFIAKHRIKRGTAAYSDADLKNRRLQFVLSSCLAGTLLAFVLGLILLLYTAVAFM